MTALAVIAGTALVASVAWDILLTLLHPAARGPISYGANRATWSTARVVSGRLLGGRGLNYAGPLAVAINVLAWLLGLWLGFALIYLPFVDSFSYDPSTPFAAKGVLEALYLSGAAITTAGFGDVVATGGVLRLVTIVEAASGFGVLTSGITFVLSVYPLISQLRSTGLQLADAGALEPEGAVRMARLAGPSELVAIVRDLTEDHEHLRRFPVLYFFESGNREESLSAVVRGSSLLVASLHCLGSSVDYAPVYRGMLEKILSRLLDDLERDFLGGWRGPSRSDDDAEAGNPADRLAELCATMCPDQEEGGSTEERERLASLLARADMVLLGLAREHGHDARGVLP